MTTNRLDLESINSLVPLAKQGNRDAQNEIFEQVYDIVLKMAHKHFGQDLKQRNNPSDIVQLTMTRMINGFENFNGQSEGEFFSWLQAILKNEIHVMRRNQNLQKRDISKEIREPADSTYQPPEGVDKNPTPSTQAIAQEKIALLQNAMNQLPEDSAMVIRLRNLEDLSFNEIADRMGRSYNAVAKLWQRAIVQLEQKLEETD